MGHTNNTDNDAKNPFDGTFRQETFTYPNGKTVPCLKASRILDDGRMLRVISIPSEVSSGVISVTTEDQKDAYDIAYKDGSLGVNGNFDPDTFQIAGKSEEVNRALHEAMNRAMRDGKLSADEAEKISTAADIIEICARDFKTTPMENTRIVNYLNKVSPDKGRD